MGLGLRDRILVTVPFCLAASPFFSGWKAGSWDSTSDAGSWWPEAGKR